MLTQRVVRIDHTGSEDDDVDRTGSEDDDGTVKLTSPAEVNPQEIIW